MDKPVLLHVDDQPGVRAALKLMLEHYFPDALELEEAEGGFEALERLKASPKVDLLITDLEMPGMDGCALVKELRSLGMLPRLPVAVLSSMATDPVVGRLLCRDVRVFLSKPIDPHALQSAIGSFLRELNPRKSS